MASAAVALGRAKGSSTELHARLRDLLREHGLHPGGLLVLGFLSCARAVKNYLRIRGSNAKRSGGWTTTRAMSACSALRSTLTSLGMMVDGTTSATVRGELAQADPRSWSATGA